MEIEKTDNTLYTDICRLIEEARTFAAQTANKTMTLLYWQIGKRINNEQLDGKRAEYGKQIVSLLATKLQIQFGKRGFAFSTISDLLPKLPTKSSRL